MDREQLQATLRELHDRLQSGEPIDPETEALLRQLSSDVDRIAAGPPTQPGTAAHTERAAEHQSALDRLLSVTQDFEESHPQLAEVIGQIATTLSRIGI